MHTLTPSTFAPALDFQPIEISALDFDSMIDYRGEARTHYAARDYKNAARCFLKALDYFPDDAHLRADFAICLDRLGMVPEGLWQARKAVELYPDHVVGLNEMGNGFRMLAAHESAAECFKHAVEAWPAWQKTENSAHFSEADLRANYAVSLAEIENFPAAIVEYKRALEIRPDCRAAQWNLPLAHLAIGQFAEGWAAYEARWTTGFMEEPPHDNGRRRWRGEDIPPLQKLHIWGEQGIGDQVLYATMLADWRPPFEIVFECHPKLEQLFKTALRHVTVVPTCKPPHPAVMDDSVVAQVPLASLGKYLRPDAAAFNPRAYLSAQPMFSLREDLVVGIAWGSPTAKVALRKSIPEMLLDPIFQVPNVAFVDLQYGNTAESWKLIRERNPDMDLTQMPSVDQYADVDKHARLIASCDLVITVSNATAHIAGAMGKETWVMPPKGQGNFWYWFVDRDDSPFYPNMRLFRQDDFGDWESAIKKVASALQEKSDARRELH